VNPPPAPTTALFLGALLSLGVVLALRVFVPSRKRLALFLAVFFGPAGHLYLKGAARYVLLMYAAWIGLLWATPLPPLISALLLTVLSVLLMNVRLRETAPKNPPFYGQG
jgi:hypothetical protein